MHASQVIKELPTSMTRRECASILHCSTKTIQRIETAAVSKCITRCMDNSRILGELLNVHFSTPPRYPLSMNSEFLETETGELLRRDSIISLVPTEGGGFTIRTTSGNVYSLSQSAGDQLLGKSKVVKK